MEKIDYKAQLKTYYKPSTSDIALVDVPPMNYLMVDGQGDPNTAAEYQEAVEALFTVAYALKFMIRKTDAIDYSVMPLEGLWWADDMSTFSVDRKKDWKWTLMIQQPVPVTKKVFERALAEVKAKNPLPALGKVRFETLREGRAAQKLHVGPFTEEGPAIQAIHDRIKGIGAKVSGKHHEIYLSDIRKAAPDKWKTIIRQPYT